MLHSVTFSNVAVFAPLNQSPTFLESYLASRMKSVVKDNVLWIQTVTFSCSSRSQAETVNVSFSVNATQRMPQPVQIHQTALLSSQAQKLPPCQTLAATSFKMLPVSASPKLTTSTRSKKPQNAKTSVGTQEGVSNGVCMSTSASCTVSAQLL